MSPLNAPRGSYGPHGEWCCTQDVADYFRVSVDTVRRWIKHGRLKAHKLGGPHTPYRIHREDVAAFVRKQDEERGINW